SVTTSLSSSMAAQSRLIRSRASSPKSGSFCRARLCSSANLRGGRNPRLPESTVLALSRQPVHTLNVRFWGVKRTCKKPSRRANVRTWQSRSFGGISHKIFAFLSQCEDGHIAPARSVLTIQPGEESGCNAPKAVHCPHRDRGPPRCWGQGGRAQARLA